MLSKQMGAQALNFASALNELAGDVNKNAALSPRNPPRAPHSRPPAHAGLASVLQAASSAAPDQPRRVRRLRLVKLTRERRLETGSSRPQQFNPRLGTTKRTRQGGRPPLRCGIRLARIKPSKPVLNSSQTRCRRWTETDRKPELCCQYPHFLRAARR